MKRITGIAVVAGLALLLTGCLLIPGKFVSRLDIHRDGTFRFTYNGEITMLALSDIADKAKKDDAAADSTFTASPCYDNDDKERACTDEEVGRQKSLWTENHDKAGKNDAEEKAMMQAMLGGMDPSDPKASAMFAEKLRKQAGWKSVVDKGHGVFEVDYEVSGRLDHDFTFPTLEVMPMALPFVAAYRNADGTVRIDAPSFAPTASGGPMLGMMSAMAKSRDAKKEVNLPPMDGTFTIVTDGEILANNTENGPSALAGGARKLDWRVTMQSASAPTALLRLGK
ncbi:MAG: hypothetical protein KGL48_01865 [Sphingomonadales bacterium]|nr:hypothetical protein [Sphingomonadales bacterium]MDE2569884.1 hypothetical protein [Sphingomonadales bacterium]